MSDLKEIGGVALRRAQHDTTAKNRGQGKSLIPRSVFLSLSKNAEVSVCRRKEQ